MLFKIAVLLLAASILWRFALGFWPWEARPANAAKGESLRDARRELGVSNTASPEEIKAAHRAKVRIAHPDGGGTQAQLEAANKARDLLLAQVTAEQSLKAAGKKGAE